MERDGNPLRARISESLMQSASRRLARTSKFRRSFPFVSGISLTPRDCPPSKADFRSEMSWLPIRSMTFLASHIPFAPKNGKGYVTKLLREGIGETRKNGARTSLSNMGANIARIGLRIKADGAVDVFQLEKSELKAALNSSSLDCSELNS